MRYKDKYKDKKAQVSSLIDAALRVLDCKLTVDERAAAEQIYALINRLEDRIVQAQQS